MKRDAPILAAGACCCKCMEGADGAPAVSEASCEAREGASLRAASCCVRRWNSARMSSSASRPCVCTARDRRSWSLQHAALPQQPLSIIARGLVQPTNTRPQVYSCEALTMTVAMQGITTLCHHQSCHLCRKDCVCRVSFLQRDTDAIWCSGVRSSLEHGGLPLQQLAPGLERLELTLLHMAMQNLLHPAREGCTSVLEGRMPHSDLEKGGEACLSALCLLHSSQGCVQLQSKLLC